MNSNNLCDIDDSCLMVVDIQERLTAAIPDKVSSRLTTNTLILLDAANRLEIPVITTAQYPKGLGPVEAQIKDRLPDASVHYEKTSFSCLGADGLKQHLAAINKKQIILAGIEAHICVLQSALDLSANNYDVFVVTDAIAARKLTSYDVAIVRLNKAGINIVNTESVLFEWLRDAAHPAFKPLSKLIL